MLTKNDLKDIAELIDKKLMDFFELILSPYLDKRFGEQDKRFDDVEERLDKIDRKLEKHDTRFEAVENKLRTYN